MHRRLSSLLTAGALLTLPGCGDDRPPLAPHAHAGFIAAADLQRGRQLIAQHGCIACHAVPGVKGPAVQVGPPLDNIPSQAYIAGVLANTPANLMHWLLDPPGITPGTAMPDVGLDDSEARDIAAYLLDPRKKGLPQ